MTVKFNGGLGAIICSHCSKTIALGFEPELAYVYSTREEDHLRVEGGDYCGKLCALAQEVKNTAESIHSFLNAHYQGCPSYTGHPCECPFGLSLKLLETCKDIGPDGAENPEGDF